MTTPLEILPDELLLQICEEMNYDQLMNLSRAYYRAFDVCQEVIQQRKKDYTLDIFYSLKPSSGLITTWNLAKIIRSKNPLTGFAKIRYYSHVNLIRHTYDKILVNQEIGNSWHDPNDKNNYLPIVSGMTNLGIINHNQVFQKYISDDDSKSVFELHNNLSKNHYEIL